MQWNNGNPVFNYDGVDLDAAISEGFNGYPGMDAFDQSYHIQAMNSFLSRLPSRDRPELDFLLSGWGADLSMTDFQILGLTFGTLPTDKFEFIPEIEPEPDTFFYSNLAGIQAYAKSEVFRELKPGKELTLCRDLANEYDCHAVSVKYQDNTVAYIKRVHCESVCRAMDLDLDVRSELVRVKLNGIINEVVVMISFENKVIDETLALLS